MFYCIYFILSEGRGSQTSANPLLRNPWNNVKNVGVEVNNTVTSEGDRYLWKRYVETCYWSIGRKYRRTNPPVLRHLEGSKRPLPEAPSYKQWMTIIEDTVLSQNNKVLKTIFPWPVFVCINLGFNWRAVFNLRQLTAEDLLFWALFCLMLWDVVDFSSTNSTTAAVTSLCTLSWRVMYGVPHGSVMGPLFILYFFPLEILC